MFYNELLFFNNTRTHIRFASNFALVKISELLQAKGMDPDVAITRAKEVFGEESEKASLYLHNIQHFFDTEIMQKIYVFISHKALFQEQVHFNSYDHMLRMLQQVSRSSFNENELKQIRHITQANHYGVALVR